MTKKVKALCESIDSQLRELAKETGAEHISVAFVSDAVYITDLTDINYKKFDYYNGGKQ